MARRRRSKNYKQLKTGTVDLGTTGDQVHIAEIRMIDDALRGSFLNNVQFSVMQNAGVGGDVDQAAAFTMYLSYESDSWSDDAVIDASATPSGGGDGNLTARRVIKTNETGSTVAEQIGPVHVWMECTDVSAETDIKARVTLTSWGRMILLVSDF